MKEKSLTGIWQQMIENLYETAKERIEFELADGDGDDCNTSSILSEVDYIENLNKLSEKLANFEQGSLKYEDLRKFTKFIKRDEGNKKHFREVLESMFEFEDSDNIEDNIESILTIVFD